MCQRCPSPDARYHTYINMYAYIYTHIYVFMPIYIYTRILRGKARATPRNRRAVTQVLPPSCARRPSRGSSSGCSAEHPLESLPPALHSRGWEARMWLGSFCNRRRRPWEVWSHAGGFVLCLSMLGVPWASVKASEELVHSTVYSTTGLYIHVLYSDFYFHAKRLKL